MATPPCSAPRWRSTAWSARCAAGGFDLEPQTLTAISAGQINFTIDQSPYLQGFLPTLYMYLFQLSGGLVSPPTTDTGLKFVTKSNVGPYTAMPTRFEGSTSAQKYIPHTGRDHRLTGSWQAGNSRPAAVHLVPQAMGESPRRLGMTLGHRHPAT